MLNSLLRPCSPHCRCDSAKRKSRAPENHTTRHSSCSVSTFTCLCSPPAISAYKGMGDLKVSAKWMPFPLNTYIAMPGSASPAHSPRGTKSPFTSSLFSAGTSLSLPQTPKIMRSIPFALMSKAAGAFIWASTTKPILNYPSHCFQN